jgi:hypothetical protein
MISSAPTALNAICPYFTMFPLDFPLRVLKRRAHRGEWVLDPFCGRGTTNYASRLLGLPSVGIDSSPVAVALTEAKLAVTTARAITGAARRILAAVGDTKNELPKGEFWELAYHQDVLRELVGLRSALIENCDTDARKALRAIVLGALHGPLTKGTPSHFSNQCQRTYAPKPRYASQYWRQRGLRPPNVDVLGVIAARAERYYADQPAGRGVVRRADSRQPDSFGELPRVRWVITSPPYYGMRTYIPDQWLRNWFMGGPPEVDYQFSHQLKHTSAEVFAADLLSVWRNVRSVARDDARLIIRFGGIADRKADPREILDLSLKGSGWRATRVVGAGTAAAGRRQALHFGGVSSTPRQEFDVWAVPC